MPVPWNSFGRIQRDRSRFLRISRKKSRKSSRESRKKSQIQIRQKSLKQSRKQNRKSRKRALLHQEQPLISPG